MKKYIAHEVNGGIFCRNIPVTVSRRLGGMPYAQAGWDDYGLPAAREYVSAFYSYSSRVFKACYKLGEGGTPQLYAIDARDANAASNYSRTTSRQCIAALRELGLNDSEVRGIKRYLDKGGKCAMCESTVHGDLWLDACTGEVIV